MMWMDSGFNYRLTEALNQYFPHDINYFIWRNSRLVPAELDNGNVDPSAFSADQINKLGKQYDRVFLHSLWLKDREILQLHDDILAKIVWVVWGHDLYKRLPMIKPTPRSLLYFGYKWLQQRSVFYYPMRNQVAHRIAKFHCIAIGFDYDEVYIHKLYGSKVPVKFGPYFSKNQSMQQLVALRTMHMQDKHPEVNIIIGHCGAQFVQHEKYLKRLAKYRNNHIHIFLVMSYLATAQRIADVRELAQSIYRQDQFTIITESMPQDEYFSFLTKMDIAIFPFLHQSALGNTKRMAYMGTKLYFDPRGVLAKGFLEGGVRTYDCRRIGKIPFDEFSKPVLPPDEVAPLFRGFEVERCISAWKNLLYD